MYTDSPAACVACYMQHDAACVLVLQNTLRLNRNGMLSKALRPHQLTKQCTGEIKLVSLEGGCVCNLIVKQTGHNCAHRCIRTVLLMNFFVTWHRA